MLICVLLAAAVAAIYWPAVGYGVVNMDDHFYVTKNPHVRSGLSVRNAAWAFRTFTESNWHPLTWISLQLDRTIDPSGFRALHLTNILLHAANSLLLFLLLEAMTGARRRSAFVAALFAVHPLHVESVAWISERKDVLSTFFWMLTMLAYLAWVRSPSTKRYLIVLASFALGLTAKPMLVSLPIVLLLVDVWPLARLRVGEKHGLRLGALVREKVLLFVLAGASCVVTYIAQLRGGAMTGFDCYPLGMRVSNAFFSYAAYLGKTIWPARLAALYPHPENTLPEWQVVLCAAFLVFVTVGAARAVRTRPYLTVGWFWYVITLVPVIGIVQVGVQGMADRYTYVPLIGIFIAVAWGVPEIAERLFGAVSGRFVVGLAVAGVAAFAAVAHKQVGYWRDDVTLFSRAVAVTKRNAVAYASLGIAYQDRGQHKKAMEAFRAGAAANPGYGPIHDCLGNALIEQGDLDEGIVHLRLAAALRPKQPEAHYNLGIALVKKGFLEEAVAEYRRAIELKPDYADAHNNLAIVLDRLASIDQALEHSRAALRLAPRNVRFRRTLAGILSHKGDAQAAIREYRTVLRLSPNDVFSRFELGRLLLGLGESKAAIDEFRRVLRLQPKLAAARINLAVALFDQGRYAQAWREVQIARRSGLKPHPGFVAALRSKMPEPQ